MADDLFTPTISAPAATARPWRVSSLVYPAFFGGLLAATVLGLINGRRLGHGAGALGALAALGAAALAGRLLVAGLAGAFLLRPAFGLVVWGGIAALQRRPFRAYELRGGEPASLVWPGLAAAVAGAIAEALLVAVIR